MKRYFFVLLFISYLVAAQTPYPETILLRQINSAEKERVRLAHGHRKHDRQPTGFYIEEPESEIEPAMFWIPNSRDFASGAAADTNVYNIEVPETTARFVRIQLAMWSDIYNGHHPLNPGTATTTGTGAQVAEFGLGLSYWD